MLRNVRENWGGTKSWSKNLESPCKPMRQVGGNFLGLLFQRGEPMIWQLVHLANDHLHASSMSKNYKTWWTLHLDIVKTCWQFFLSFYLVMQHAPNTSTIYPTRFVQNWIVTISIEGLGYGNNSVLCIGHSKVMGNPKTPCRYNQTETLKVPLKSKPPWYFRFCVWK
jgi:quinol-cytochrome oxidoreductase complex cytochrome b subunit